ncbi:MAG: transcriptional regulator [Candidatus Bathyarchaeota archaeon]|nr:MAG: transcriptional regulator [Candidatus Bathyarchaeota archaeon]
MSLSDSVRDMLAKRIAGEIVLSSSPGSTMRKWRTLLQVSQIDVANELELSPSVVSDYETGRRRSPGSGFIKRFVGALLEIDEKRGGRYIQQLARITLDPGDVFLDIREFVAPATIREVCEALECDVLVGEEALEQDVFGYTVIDSVKAIQTLSGLDFYRIFGTTSERALIFVGVSRGRSPMIAVKISPFKPRIIILHGITGEIDPLAIKLAQSEGTPLAISRLSSQDELVEELLKVYRLTQE